MGDKNFTAGTDCTPSPEGCDSGSGVGELTRHHEWFRRLLAEIVTSQHANFPESADQWWVVQCYDSKEALEGRFPDSVQREEFLRSMEEGMRSHREGIAELIKEKLEKGLTYLDAEMVRYEFGELDD